MTHPLVTTVGDKIHYYHGCSRKPLLMNKGCDSMSKGHPQQRASRLSFNTHCYRAAGSHNHVPLFARKARPLIVILSVMAVMLLSQALFVRITLNELPQNAHFSTTTEIINITANQIGPSADNFLTWEREVEKLKVVSKKIIPNNASANDMMNLNIDIATIENKDANQRLKSKHAIIHIGPHKTGSTTIQSFTKTLVKDLIKDHYEMPWVAINGWESQIQFATCFFNRPFIHPIFPCDPKLLESANNIAMRNSSLLISSEAFDRPEVNLTSLKEYLSPWNVTVVYVYRRYYSWLQSFYNEATKHTRLDVFLANSTEYLRQNITEYIAQRFLDLTPDYMDRYVAPERFKKEFNHVVILNMHDKKTDFIQQFFCNVMPHSTNTCTAVKARKGSTARANPSIVLTYHDLAYRAHRLGMIHISTQHQLTTAVKLIEQHQKVTLKLSDTDFELICPNSTLLDALLERSLRMEQLMVPEFFQGPWGESELRSDFENQAKSSLCDVNLSGTVKSREWAGFFASLNESLSSMV